MEYEQIKKLMEDMGESKLTDVSIEFPDGVKISMKKEATNVQTSKVEIKQETETEEKEEDNKNDFKLIKSPMVGTFYSKPSPDAKPYVSVGQHVEKGQVLCIIEAMKLLNEIEADTAGTIEEILVTDGESVDFGKILFKLS